MNERLSFEGEILDLGLREIADSQFEAAVRRSLAGKSSRDMLPSAKPRVLIYSPNEVIDDRISVPAQHSLVRLSEKKATSADAVGMLEEVKAGRLAGIYCVNWDKSSQRALRFRKSWWTVIPKGEDAVLMLDPDDLLRGKPLIAYRRELDPECGLMKDEKRFAPSPSRLDNGLLRAWKAYLGFRRGEIIPCMAGATRGKKSFPALESEVSKGPKIGPLSSVPAVIPMCIRLEIYNPGFSSSGIFFPRRYTDSLSCKSNPRNPPAVSFRRDDTLQSRLNKAIKDILPSQPNVAFIIVQLDQAGIYPCHPYAGYMENRLYYSASLLKVAAVYAAFELRDAANRIAKGLKTQDDKALFEALECSTLQIVIKGKEILSGKSIRWNGPKNRPIPGLNDFNPKYRRVFESHIDPVLKYRLIKFTKAFCSYLRGIFADQSGFVYPVCAIHGIGYNYIVGALESAGFFDNSSKQGIWLAADYTGASPPTPPIPPKKPLMCQNERKVLERPGYWPYYLVNSDNDGDVGEAMTAYQMAKLYTLLWDRRSTLLRTSGVFDSQDASNDMLSLMAGAFSWLKDDLKKYNVTHSKVGEGQLKGGAYVFSEASILAAKNGSQTYAVVWQNYITNNPNFKLIAEVIESTLPP